MALTCISPFNLLQTFNLIHDSMHRLAHAIPFWISHFTLFPHLYWGPSSSFGKFIFNAKNKCSTNRSVMKVGHSAKCVRSSRFGDMAPKASSQIIPHACVWEIVEYTSTAKAIRTSW
jgi:hypothetical protein